MMPITGIILRNKRVVGHNDNMKVVINESGCCIKKGMSQIRLDMFLDEKDYGYDRRYVEVPDMSKEKYPGKVDDNGNPVDMIDYQKWVDSLPKKWQLNPFHVHFIKVHPDTSEKEIMDIADAFLQEAYIKWACDQKIDCSNDALPVIARVT
jgi:hypothetical protein